MKRIGMFITLIERRLSEILLLFMVVFVFIAASLRWFGYPLVWSVDLAQLLFIWISFIGADIALQNNKHIGVDILTRNLPEKVYKKMYCSLSPLFKQIREITGYPEKPV